MVGRTKDGVEEQGDEEEEGDHQARQAGAAALPDACTTANP